MNRRHSIQKQMILDALKTLRHPTAQDVLDEVRRSYPHISMATVYRNLNLLAQDGAIRPLSFPDSPERFDTQTQPHYHARCMRCGRIFDIDTHYLDELDRKVEQGTGFTIESHSIFFQGICPLCKTGENIKNDKGENHEGKS